MMKQAKEKTLTPDTDSQSDVVSHPALMQRRLAVLLARTEEADHQILAQLDSLDQLSRQLGNIFPSDAVQTVADWIGSIRGKISRTRPASVEGVICRTEALIGLNTLKSALNGPTETCRQTPPVAELIAFPG